MHDKRGSGIGGRLSALVEVKVEVESRSSLKKGYYEKCSVRGWVEDAWAVQFCPI